MPVSPDRASKAVAYLRILAAGTLGYIVIAAILLSAYLLTQGDAFLVPTRTPSLAFIQIFGAPTFVCAFVPFAVTHAVATHFRWPISPLSATLAGGLMGALAGWYICGRQGCFTPFGSLPLLGWYIVATTALSALFLQLYARKKGF